MAALLTTLEPLVAALRADGYRVIGPTRDGDAVVLAELTSAAELPYGWTAELAPGRYRLRHRAGAPAFGSAGSADSWKTWLHPARTPLCTITRDPDGRLRSTGPAEVPPRYALLGVHPCDLRAIAVLDRVLAGGARPDEGYAARRAGAFVVAVNCTRPAPTCFCTSVGGGPVARDGFDLCLTELPGDRYVAEPGSPTGERLLAALHARAAGPAELATARSGVARAADAVGRSVPPVDLAALLAGAREHPRWDDVAARCVTCGNCTMVCPTCYCTAVIDSNEIAEGPGGAQVARRTAVWDSCFDPEYSYLHGGAVRTSARARYRQWLSHKFGTWHEQFGESGCVGCGRCIVWCPVGIDVTEELYALADAGPAGGGNA